MAGSYLEREIIQNSSFMQQARAKLAARMSPREKAESARLKELRDAEKRAEMLRVKAAAAEALADYACGDVEDHFLGG